MYIKDIRNNQIEGLKNNSFGTVKYVVELLNGSFIPYKTVQFDTMEQANKYYNESNEGPAFKRKYAKISF